MPKKEVVLTQEGLRKLEKELEYLKSVKRKEVADRIKQAISFGDLSENSEYDEAKNEQAFVEGKIAMLEEKLRNAKVIDDADISTETVTLGSKVLIRDLDTEEAIEYTIVSSAEANPIDFKISNESPVGKALMGAKKGDVIEISVPAGQVRYRVEEIKK
ncbi:transcription elongation factor GreA [Thermosediminibacter oceani]|uniref:Transcription elongation factor GreA n=1 Tax=Thermosediminibacter oceani (strain ATCC BAA-1034 / DSM 16646 / JW/IW-1228P) TaxID=555079 RepID=D9S026_THEOJ|nr:transcription elongation factor GreA [Thermosediminibacter oceani]ADL06954.1 GreA/GreB family elongation factor [Thermosediminibacter oceani DSM 16646]